MSELPVALSIAGSDPTGGGGLQADLQVFRALSVHGAGVVTALTVQDTERVFQVLPAFPNVVLEQLRRLIEDFVPDAIKVGMLGTDDVVRNVELALSRIDPALRVPVVVDPVLAASDGTLLLERRGHAALQDLIARCTLVTPNLPEAETLTGCDVSTEEGVQAAAAALVTGMGANAALVKGGHRDGAPDDLLALREGGTAAFTWLRDGERLQVGPVRGTGCALASAITAHLARGTALPEAVAAGRRFLADALRASVRRGKKAGFLVYP
ncbi:MAG: bifunctional hydroxymethylpyrimidine kinase/phosphomethylpyrimidine kinase [Myxococcota bacterium]